MNKNALDRAVKDINSTPCCISDADYAKLSLKVIAKWVRDPAAMKTHVVFYAESYPAVMPTEPGDYQGELLIHASLVETGNLTDCVVPACNAADAAAHSFCAHSKTGHSGTAWVLACRDAFAEVADEHGQ